MDQPIHVVLLADHRRLDGLLARLIAAFEVNDREDIQALWTSFEAGLVAHLQAEEETLIPALRESNPAEADALLAEHDGFRRHLAALGAGIDLHIVRLDTARAFATELMSHAAREDEALYRWSDLHLHETVRASFLEAFTEAMRRARDVLRRRETAAK